MRKQRIVLTLALLTLVAPVGLAGAEKAKKETVTRTAKAARKAGWGSNVSITVGNGFFEFRSDGLPNHSRPSEYAVPNNGVVVPSASSAHAVADPTTAQSYDFQIPTRPKLLKNGTSTGGGMIGVMISGAVLFSPYEGDGTTVALASNFTVKDSAGNDVSFVDSCNGHPTPMGVYHYHGLPRCVTSQVDKPKGPSHIIGFALDGFPIYGDRNIKGKKVGAGRLDACNGIKSPTPEFPNGIYHYVLLEVPTAQSSIRCFRGQVSSTLGQQGPPGGQGPPAARAALTSSSSTYYCHLPS